jgi:hypothetical protein
MIFSILLALSGLTLSAVAIYYSVIGLTSIFAAAFWPVVVMGTTLEVSKLVAASWLKAYWTSIPKLMKAYMSIAVIVLMVITSMGIFGYLSKAHLDQNIVSGDVMSKISIFDEKIKTAKDNIDANRKALKQMDEAVDQVMARSNDEKGAEKAVAIRRSQAKERARLQSEIAAEQKTIASLNEERAPIAADVRKVEAEVGPIKYIAALIYGDNPDTNILEKAVTWVIMIIVFVFDPLAVLMLLAAQMTWAWRKEEHDVQLVHDTVPAYVEEPMNDAKYEQDDGPLTEEQIKQIQELAKEDLPKGELIVKDELFPKEEAVETVDSTMPVADIDAWNKMIEAAEAEVAKEKESTLQERLATGETYIDGAGEEINLLEGYEFPENPVAGDEFRKLSTTEDSREYIFNGDQWVNTETSDSDALLQILAQVEESKKKTYMIKEENQQVIKTTNK